MIMCQSSFAHVIFRLNVLHCQGTPHSPSTSLSSIPPSLDDKKIELLADFIDVLFAWHCLHSLSLHYFNCPPQSWYGCMSGCEQMWQFIVEYFLTLEFIWSKMGNITRACRQYNFQDKQHTGQLWPQSVMANKIPMKQQYTILCQSKSNAIPDFSVAWQYFAMMYEVTTLFSFLQSVPHSHET